MSRIPLPWPKPRSVLPVAVVLVLVVVSSSLAAMPVAAAEDPRFEASVPEPELTPGTQQTLTVSITNDATGSVPVWYR